MSRFLLDINALLALLDPMHIHHEDAHQWYEKTSPEQLMICTHVANGVMRVASQPRYPNCLGTSGHVRKALKKFVEHMEVESCDKDASLMDDEVLKKPELLTPANITDLYLLAIAVANNAKLATFDKRIQPSAILGGKSAIEIIPSDI